MSKPKSEHNHFVGLSKLLDYLEVPKERQADLYDSLERGAFEARFLSYVGEAFALYQRKNMDYGDAWRENGAKGIYIYIKNKASRLKKLLWQGNVAMVMDEGIRDTLLDMLNYSIMGLYLVDERDWHGD